MSAHTFMSEDEREETIIERRERERLESGKIENMEEIPLIPNVKQDQRKTVHAINVWKMDSPGDGYKGAVPPGSTLQTIAKLYGNGLYNFDAVTQDEKVLRRNQGVRIAFAIPESTKSDKQSNGQADMQLLQWQAEQHAKETKRIETFGQMVVDHTRATASEHVQALTAAQNLQAQRDREFFGSLMAQQQQFFATMLQASQIEHRQAMERQREDFQRTIQIQTLAHERMSQSNDPQLLLGLFREGLALGAGAEPTEEPEKPEIPWLEAVKAGTGAIKEIAQAAKMNAIAVPKQQAKRPQRVVARVTPAQNPQPHPEPDSEKRVIFTKQELAELLRMKQIMDQKGLDFASTVRNAALYLTGQNDADQAESEIPESDESGEHAANTPEETGEAHVGD